MKDLQCLCFAAFFYGSKGFRRFLKDGKDRVFSGKRKSGIWNWEDWETVQLVQECWFNACWISAPIKIIYY
jgi:hypothetical protein